MKIRHQLPSLLLSADDDPGRPTRQMIDLALDAARLAADCDLPKVRQRIPEPPYLTDIWPGEHYKLIAGLVKVLQPQVVVEVGTFTGLSALAFREFLPQSSYIVTFDIIPWQNFPQAAFRDSDFEDGQLIQAVEDLTNLEVARRYEWLLKAADLIFIDAAKDGKMELRLLNNLASVGLKEGAWLLFDDIRFLTMIPIWRQIGLPKLDLTSFGHWSGTGLVQWTNTVPWSVVDAGTP